MESEAKTKRMNIYLSDSEKDVIKSAAKAASVPPAVWARMVILKAAKERVNET